jgi:hypothetical protein
MRSPTQSPRPFDIPIQPTPGSQLADQPPLLLHLALINQQVAEVLFLNPDEKPQIAQYLVGELYDVCRLHPEAMVLQGRPSDIQYKVHGKGMRAIPYLSESCYESSGIKYIVQAGRIDLPGHSSSSVVTTQLCILSSSSDQLWTATICCLIVNGIVDQSRVQRHVHRFHPPSIGNQAATEAVEPDYVQELPQLFSSGAAGQHDRNNYSMSTRLAVRQ